MLKKITFLFAVFLLATSSIFAQLPYSKMLNLTNEELKEKKFKYDANKNQFVLSKSNATNQTMNILNAIGGNTADSRPHPEDYRVTIQKGADNQTAFLSVLFYSDDTFHNIETWMAENNVKPIETSSGKLIIQKFNYDAYTVEIDRELVEVKAVTTRTAAAAKSIDQSYNVYTCTIFTGVAPESKWHTKEAEKKAKNKLKGKKEDLDDLM